MKGTILFYAVGPIHPRNLQLLAREMNEWTFQMIYEPELWWMKPEMLRSLQFEKHAFVDGRVPDSLNDQALDAVVFSTAQIRHNPVKLIRWAFERKLPTIAIQEVNQLGLNCGRVNHYLLPVDHILVASDIEMQHLMHAGVPKHRLQVTGWPFYNGPKCVDKSLRREKKRDLGFDPDRPVALLTLTKLNEAGETPAVRSRQIELATGGLSKEYQIAVKPHPVETSAELAPFLRGLDKESLTIMDGSTSIDILLDASDILLNRGVSQVAIESLMRHTPVVILDVGEHTPFHQTASSIVAGNESEVASIVTKIECEPLAMEFYQDFLALHVPFSPEVARQQTGVAVAQLAMEKIRDPRPDEQRLEVALMQGALLDNAAAREALFDVLGQNAQVLRRLLDRKAIRTDMRFLNDWGESAVRKDLLRCLWIDQLLATNATIGEEDLRWLEAFPPQMNLYLYVEHCLKWFKLLWNSGRTEAAYEFIVPLREKFDGTSVGQRIAVEVKLHSWGKLGRGLCSILLDVAIFRKTASTLRHLISRVM